MPRSWTKIVTVLKGCFNLSPRCQGDFHKNLGCFSSTVRLLSNDQASTPLQFSGRFCRTRKRNSRAWQPLISELLWSVLLKSSSLFLPVPFLLPEDSARKALSWFGPWLVAKRKHEFTQKRKKKSNCQEGRGSRLCSVSSWEAHPMSPHQGLGCYKTHPLSSSSPNRSASSLQSRPQLAPGLAGWSKGSERKWAQESS